MKVISFGIIPIKKVGAQYLLLLIHELGGYWGFPKGHSEPGETNIETAMRELCEETGVDECDIIDDFSHTKKYSFNKNDQQIEKEVVFYLGIVNEEKEILQNNEVQEAKWLSFEDASEKIPQKEDQQMLKEVQDYLQKSVPLSLKRHRFDCKDLLK